MEFKDVLQHYLNEENITQAQLAAQLNTSRSSIGNLMQGRTKEPSLHKAYAIAKALNISVDEMLELLYGDEEVTL